jgi:MoxR-like ATPase
MQPQALQPQEFSQLARRIESEIARVIVGQHDVVRGVLICILAGRHALLEGVPGLGKTSLIRTIADVLDLRFSRLQFTPDMMPADITGTDILEENEHGGRTRQFQPGPIFANLVLADEINRATPKTQSAMLEAMQESTVTVIGKRYELEAPFFVLATQNPLEMEGTYPLPEAQLDRFLFKIMVPFPKVDELVTILERTTGTQTPKANTVANAQQVLAMRDLALTTPVASHVQQTIAEMVMATHPQHATATPLVKQYVSVGASPRGAQALMLGAKVQALLEGRFNVAFDDVITVAKPALRHRVLLNFNGQADQVSADDIVDEVIKLTLKKNN